MSNCKIINRKWEDKGIILGIIQFILMDYQKIMTYNIYLRDSKIRKLVSILFEELKFTKKRKESNFIIRIRSNKKGDLIINNINNLNDTIYVKKYYLLPWYDNDNPLIMYNIGKKSQKKKQIKKKFKSITCKRGIALNKQNYITAKCGDIWDTRIEYKILSQYCELKQLNIRNVYKLINKYLTKDMCGIKKYKKIITTNLCEPQFIPYPETQFIERPPILSSVINSINKIESEQANLPTQLPQQIINLDPVGMNLFIDILDKLNSKFITLNNIIDK